MGHSLRIKEDNAEEDKRHQQESERDQGIHQKLFQ